MQKARSGMNGLLCFLDVTLELSIPINLANLVNLCPKHPVLSGRNMVNQW
jgi:hypothetical protein